MTRRDEPVLVGLDAGTTLVKAVAFDPSGRPLAVARRHHPPACPAPGHAELDPLLLWQTAAAVLRELAGNLENPGRIAGIGVAGTMGGLLLLDARNRPVRPAVLWNDGRAAPLLRNWRRDGTLDAIFDVSANAPAPGFTLPLLACFSAHEPDTLARAKTHLFPKDWLTFNLTGRLATDPTDASHAPGDVHAATFSHALFELLKIPDLVRLLPPVVPCGHVIGRVTRDAAGHTGLPEGTPVVAGLADVSATLLGTTMAVPGNDIAVAGTSLLNCRMFAAPVFEPRNVGVSFIVPGGHDADRHQTFYHARALPNQTGALALEWVARELFGGARPETLEPLAAAVPPGTRGLTFHPYLNSTGVLAPLYEPRARGRLHGLALHHTKHDILRAAWEGLAFALADCYDAMPSPAFPHNSADNDPPAGGGRPVTIIGGLARSRLFLQLVADVTGRPVATPDVPEAGALGVAILAGVAAGVWPDPAAAADALRRPVDPVRPDDGRTDFYRHRLRLYKHLRCRLTEDANVADDAPDT